MRNNKYTLTYLSCYLGYFVQAIVVNLSPIFFIVFQNKYNVSYSTIANLIFICFLSQITIDLLSIKICDHLSFRQVGLIANSMSALGLILLGILPAIMNPVLGIFLATIVCAIGAGFIEVIISPIVDAIPKDHGSGSMSLLHSFYCWGQVLTVAFSTLLLLLIGDDLWYIIPISWSIIPIIDVVLFSRANMPEQVKTSDRTPLKSLFSTKNFVFFMIIMICSGASEIAVSQWASLFVQVGLGVNKTLGDLLGPCMFAIMMGLGRTIFGSLGSKIDYKKTLLMCSIGCALSYLALTIVPSTIVGLIACSTTGFCVSFMWPGTLTLGSSTFPNGAVRMFSIFAICGDLGCLLGPWIAGQISDLVVKSKFAINLTQTTGLTLDQISLKTGILFSVIFPIIMTITLLLINGNKKHDNN